MRDAGLVGFRRHHPYVVGQRAADVGADVEARRVNAVIVGDENTHQFFPITFMPPIYFCNTSGTAIEPSSCW